MLLLIDAGNTQIKWALVDSVKRTGLAEWKHAGSLSHQELMQAQAPWHHYSVQRVIVSNVAGEKLRHSLARSFPWPAGVVEWFSSQKDLAGIKNSYHHPEQLGSDRFASAIAAHALFPRQALMIATCGTALTMDAVSAEGEFMGGMIAPGLQLMAQSLAQNTAQLPFVLEHKAIVHFANHTEAAIISGCLAAQVGAIERAVHDFALTTNATTPPLCVLSGGAAKYVIPSLRIAHQFVDNLVLTGLQVSSC